MSAKDDDFISAMQQFGDHVAIIRCSSSSPKRKKRKRANSPTTPLPRFIIRFSLQNDAFNIEAINMSKMYRLSFNEDELRDHLTETLQSNLSWNRYFKALSATFDCPSSNMTLTKGKGGGYMILSVQYPIQKDITLTNNFDLSLIDEYEEDEEFDKNDLFMSLIESALSQQNTEANEQDHANDNDFKNNEYDELKANYLALQQKTQILEQQNVRLNAMTQNSNNLNIANNMNLSQSMEQSLVMSNLSNKQNAKKRKQRDPKLSLMNPRRAKKRKKIQFAGLKKN